MKDTVVSRKNVQMNYFMDFELGGIILQEIAEVDMRAVKQKSNAFMSKMNFVWKNTFFTY